MHTPAPSPRLQLNVRAPCAQLAPPAAAATTLHRERSQPCSTRHAAHAWPRQRPRQMHRRPARQCQRGGAVAASLQQEEGDDPRGLAGAAAAVIASSPTDAAAALDLSEPRTGGEQTVSNPPAAASATGASTAFEARITSANGLAVVRANCQQRQVDKAYHTGKPALRLVRASPHVCRTLIGASLS